MNEATPYLHAKLVTAAKEHFSALGLMTKEDIREQILVNKFSVRETELAVNHCVGAGALELYYVPVCKHCGGKSVIQEHDPSSESKLKEITGTGYTCRHCVEFQKAVTPVVTRYAIAHELLGGPEEDYDLGPGLWKRFVMRLKAAFDYVKTVLGSIFLFFMWWRHNE